MREREREWGGGRGGACRGRLGGAVLVVVPPAFNELYMEGKILLLDNQMQVSFFWKNVV